MMKHAKRIVTSVLGAGCLLTGAGALYSAPAQAQTVYANNFDNENGGATALRYTGFDGLTVTRGGVDLIESGDYGIICAGGGGACVDLSNDVLFPNGQLTSGSYAFGAGQTVTLSFLLRGNQAFLPGIYSGDWSFDFGSALTGTWGYSIDGAAFDMGSFAASGLANTYSLLGTDPFRPMTMFFTPDSAGAVSFSIGSFANAGVGAVLDDVSLSMAAVTPPVPEPATWAMMILGFGAAAAAIRRRRHAAFAAMA